MFVQGILFQNIVYPPCVRELFVSYSGSVSGGGSNIPHNTRLYFIRREGMNATVIYNDEDEISLEQA
jgi:hypothetical protein